MKRIFSKVLSAAMVVMLLAGCGTSSATKATEEKAQETQDSQETQGTTEGEYDGTVKIAFSTWTGYAPFFVARDAGIFEKNGVDVELVIMENGGDKKAAMASGKLQAVAETVDTNAMAIAAGLDHVQVLALDTSDGGDGVVAKNEIESFEDLKGKEVALDTTGGASIFYFNYLLKQNNMTMDDLVVQNMSSGDAGAAFVGGKVDAAVTWEPWLTNAKNTDFGHVLEDSSTAPGVIVDSLSFSSDFIQKYPATVQKIVDSWCEAVDYYNENHDESVKMMANGFGMDAADIESTLPTVKFYDKADNEAYFKEGKIDEISQMAMDLWFDMGLISEKADISKCIDKSFVVK